MMMVPYMFNEALMDDLFSNDWEHDAGWGENPRTVGCAKS